jgi:peptide/nickel transport system substrate-binding protein
MDNELVHGDEGLTRRQILGRAIQVGATLGVASAISACGASSSVQNATGKAAAGALTELPGGTPVRGGTFTLGVTTAGQAENVFPGLAATPPDIARDYLLYNLLWYPGRDVTSNLEPGLAVSADHNADATVWTFHLRDAVEWHDGRTFTADDLVYNFKTLWSDPNANYSAAILEPLIDFRNVRKRGPLAVEIPLKIPVAQLPGIFAFLNFGIVQEGATKESAASHPIGTGPFKFQSFTPGSQSVFVANKNYWESGKPYVDEVQIISSFTDTDALYNALLSGKINLSSTLALLNARELAQSNQAQILVPSQESQGYGFGMRVDDGPFADIRVRQAFKLLTDRPAIVNAAFAGFGGPGNDLIGAGTEYFLGSATPTYDPEKARALFKAAGVLGDTFTLPVAEVFPGFVESASVLAGQASAAGVTLAIQRVDPATYFVPPPGGTAYVRPSTLNTWPASGCIAQVYLGELLPTSPWSDTHWGRQVPGGAAATKLIYQAIGETDPGKAGDLWREVQQQQIAEGGYVVYSNQAPVDAAAPNVRGLKAGAGLNFNNFRLQDGWIQA